MRVLLAQRPPGKAYAGYWEFPGGKVEAGETPRHALVRELDRRILNVKGEMIRELEAKLRTFDERERAIRESIVRYKERYLSLPQAAIQLARLERDVMVNSNLYAALKSKHQEFMIKGAEQIEEVPLIEPAPLPARPTNAPNLPLNAFLGVLMGGMVGLVAALRRRATGSPAVRSSAEQSSRPAPSVPTARNVPGCQSRLAKV